MRLAAGQSREIERDDLQVLYDVGNKRKRVVPHLVKRKVGCLRVELVAQEVPIQISSLMDLVELSLKGDQKNVRGRSIRHHSRT